MLIECKLKSFLCDFLVKVTSHYIKIHYNFVALNRSYILLELPVHAMDKEVSFVCRLSALKSDLDFKAYERFVSTVNPTKADFVTPFTN